jgi:hypothetical protein
MNKDTRKINWADEDKPFFEFEVPYGGMVVFDNASVHEIEQSLIDNFDNDDIIPVGRISNSEDPYIKELMEGMPAEMAHRRITSIIIPIRYKKVFKT